MGAFFHVLAHTSLGTQKMRVLTPVPSLARVSCSGRRQGDRLRDSHHATAGWGRSPSINNKRRQPSSHRGRAEEGGPVALDPGLGLVVINHWVGAHRLQETAGGSIQAGRMWLAVRRAGSEAAAGGGVALTQQQVARQQALLHHQWLRTGHRGC